MIELIKTMSRISNNDHFNFSMPAMTFARSFTLLTLIFVQSAWGSQLPEASFAPATSGYSYAAESSHAPLTTASGLVTLDYQIIPVPGYPSIDLVGLHYLHQLNPWLYLGVGVDAPLVKGNYGGFMVFDTTLHAQQKIYGNLFVDAGLSLGGGGGGSSKEQSKELSGHGGYLKQYAGLGYDFGSYLAGVNFSHVSFTHSLIDHSQLNFYLQIPLSYSLGSYADSGKRTLSDRDFEQHEENILAIELNNIVQIDPQGSNKEPINAMALQYAHFFNSTEYVFVDAEVGYAGIGLYNQALGGIGSRLSVSPNWNLYGQIGVGSGGWAPDVIDTGPGLLVYPKISAEYLLSRNIGLALSGGYLYAPEGSSKNATVGVALNYHLASGGKRNSGVAWEEGRTLQGFRFNLFQQTLYDVSYGQKSYNSIYMLATQIDCDLNSDWYIPVLAAIAYTDAHGYPGYGELYAGLGRNYLLSRMNNISGYIQLTIGTNTKTLVRPAVGLSFEINEKLALYSQIAETVSLDRDPNGKRFSDHSLGIGLSYRFSVPD